MLKIFAAFVVFAAAALFFIFQAGDKVNMQGEAAGHNPTEAQASASHGTAPAKAAQ